VTSQRIHGTASSDFFKSFVSRYPDRQYQTSLGGRWIDVGIDYDYDELLKNKLAAAITSHFGQASFSNALKIISERYGKDCTSLPRFETIVDRVERRFLLTSLSFLQQARPEGTIKEEHSGVIHAELFMLRLLTSFEAARRLINWGFFSEPLTIVRSALEQLSWAYAVGIKFDRKQLQDPAPSKCVGLFKERFSAAGQLYGALSRFSHMEFDAQKHFVIHEPSGTAVMQQSAEFKLFGMLFYLFVLTAYQFVCRDLRRYYLQECGLDLKLHNIVLPLRHLIAHPLMKAELDNDEIAAILTLIYFDIFPSKTKST
jgi:hypothetical protein